MWRLKTLKRRKGIEAERIYVVVPTPVEDMTSSTLQRENVLVLFAFMHWTLVVLA